MRRFKSGRIGALCAQTYLVLVIAFLFFPALVLVAFSFNKSPFFNLPFTGVTLHWFSEAFRNSAMVAALENSLEIASLTAVCATVGGFGVSLALRGARRRVRRSVDAIAPLPLLVPSMIWSIALLIAMHRLGIQPSIWSVLCGHVLLTLPFVVLLLTTRLGTVQREWDEVSTSLGASRWMYLRRIFVPHMLPAIIAGALMAFTLSFNDFIIAFFLTGQGFNTLPVYIYSLIEYQADPSIAAMASCVFVLALILVVAIAKLQGREAAASAESLLSRDRTRLRASTGGHVVGR
jgi:spermidine/putrescine transport system permease protein